MEFCLLSVVGELSDMYGNRGIGRFGGQQGLLANANFLMGNQMPSLAVNQANMRLLNQGGGQRDLRGGAGLFPTNPSMGMRERQQAGSFSMNNRMNMAPQAQDAVIDILVISWWSVMSNNASDLYAARYVCRFVDHQLVHYEVLTVLLTNNNLSYHRGTAQRAMSVHIFSSAAQLCKSCLKGLKYENDLESHTRSPEMANDVL